MGLLLLETNDYNTSSKSNEIKEETHESSNTAS